MEHSESKDLPDSNHKRSLKSDRFFQASIVVILIGTLMIILDSLNYYSIPPEPVSSPITLYDLGTYILLVGIIMLLIAALARYLSDRMSGQDFWWVVKTGPFTSPT
jgi:hypothetical protein